MAISDKLTYLNETKTLLKNKINLTGANITNDTFRQYPTKLQNALLECWNNEGEPIFTNWGTKVNGEGTNVKLDNTINARMKITPKGNTSQNGTPTPSSPIDVNVVSGDNEIVVCGKNLFDKTTITENQRLDPSGGNNYDENCDLSDYIKIQPNTTYTRNITASVYECICFYTINKTFIRRDTTHATTTSPNNAYYVRISCYKTNLDTLQLEKGSSATSFEPYQGANYQVNLGSLELCKIGNYQDYFYKDNGKWYLHKEIGKVVLNGSQGPWAKGSASGTTYSVFQADDWGVLLYVGSITSIYSDKLVGGDNFTAPLTGEYIQTGVYPSAPIRVSILNSRLSEVNSNGLNTYLATNNITCYIPLKTPTNIEITNTTLINQLENLKSAMSYEGQTNISSGFMIVGASALGELE